MQREELLGLVGPICDASLEPGRWPSVLRQICSFVDAAAAAIFWQDAFDQSAAVLHAFGEDAHRTQLYLRTRIARNPLFLAMNFIEPGIVVAGGDLMPHEEFRQTRFFREWVEPRGFADVAAVNLERFATRSACFSVCRSPSQGAIDAEAVRRLELVVPHIRRALLIERQLARRERASLDLRSVLDAATAGVFLVNENSRLGFVNEAGRRLLGQGDIVIERDGALRACIPHADRALKGAVGSPSSGGRKTVSVALTDTKPRWLADILPLSPDQRLDFEPAQNASAAVFVRKAEIPVLPGIETLARLYRLTASEIRVLQEAVGGGSVNEIAEALGLSLGTVKTHLQSLFVKTGTNRRADLVREVAAHGVLLV